MTVVVGSGGVVNDVGGGGVNVFNGVLIVGGVVDGSSVVALNVSGRKYDSKVSVKVTEDWCW